MDNYVRVIVERYDLVGYINTEDITGGIIGFPCTMKITNISVP